MFICLNDKTLTMKNKILIVFVLAIFVACSSRKKEDPGFEKEFPAASAMDGTINTYRVGDTFCIITSYNSCCSECWTKGNDENWKDELKDISIPFLKVIGTDEYYDAPEDCAGCSTVYRTIFRVERSGMDTLTAIELANGQIADFKVGCAGYSKDFRGKWHKGDDIYDFASRFVIKAE